jgi:SAM-dependent methyltransferase
MFATLDPESPARSTADQNHSHPGTDKAILSENLKDTDRERRMSENWTAASLLEATASYWQGCTIMAGVRLDLFNHLHNEADSAAGLGTRIGADTRALGMLLRALAALGLLEQHEGVYSCTASARQFLASTSPAYLGDIISHQHHLVESWAQLDQAVKTGQPQRQRSSFSVNEWHRSFLLGMQNLADLIAPQLVPQIPIGERDRMLDLGGGPGTWSIHFCRHNPGLHSTILDLPASRELAEKAIADADMTRRIDFTGGDFNHAELSDDYDLIWMSHILHGESESNCQALVAKAAAALKPQGLLIIHEFILDDHGSGPVYPALFALNMLLGTEDGATYSEAELKGMMATAGLDRIERLALPPQSRSGVLIARKSALH